MRFSHESSLPSCRITKELVASIEEYLLSRLQVLCSDESASVDSATTIARCAQRPLPGPGHRLQTRLDLRIEVGFGGANADQPLDARVDPLERHDDDAVLISGDDVAVRDRDTGDDDRKTDGAGALARRRVRRDAGSEARQADLADAGYVTDATIGDEADGAAVPRHAEQQIAGHRATEMAGAGGDDDVPGLQRIERRKDGEIVRRTGVAGDRGAAERRLFRHHRLDPVVERAGAAERVDQEAGRHTGQCGNLFRTRPAQRLRNLDFRGIVDHCESPRLPDGTCNAIDRGRIRRHSPSSTFDCARRRSRAAAAGYDALVLTIDNQLLGNRERDICNGFGIPPRFTAAQLLAMAPQLPWLWRMRHTLASLTFGNYAKPGSTESLATLAGRMGTLLDPGMNWDHVRGLRERWFGPLLLKGVLAPAEAIQAARIGVDGIIVSNHGGRQLDGAISSIEALPAIVDALAAVRMTAQHSRARVSGDRPMSANVDCSLTAAPPRHDRVSGEIPTATGARKRLKSVCRRAALRNQAASG